jgi:MFS family permease
VSGGGFRRLWLAGLVSETGDWLLLIALPVYVLQRTGSTLTTSTVFLLELAGTVLAGPLAGVLADRWDRRRLLVGAGLAQAVLLLPLLAGTLPVIYAVTLAQAVLATVNGPVRQALLPDVVAPADLAAATARLGVAANLARLAGGALGGLLLGAYGLTSVVLADAATFLLATAVLAGRSGAAALTGPTSTAGRPGGGGPGSGGPGSGVREGLAVVRADRRLRGTVAVVVLLGLAQGMFVVLFVVFVLRRLGDGPTEVGLLRGMQAVGAVAGGLVLGAVARRTPPRRLAGGGILAFAAVCAAIWNLPAATTALPPYVGLFVLVGVPAAAGVAGLQATVLAAAPERFRGRVLSTVLVADAVAQATGTLAAGLLADAVGLLPLLEAHAALIAVAGLAGLRLLAAPRRPVAQQHPADDLGRPVRPAVVGGERVVPLQPPAALDRPDRPLDHQQVRAAREPADDHVARTDPVPGPDEECVPVPQGRRHGGADHEDAGHGPAE